jgi:regulatory protein
MVPKRPMLTPEQAWQRITRYCAYQERSHAEAKEKLYSLGLRRAEVETTLSRLIEENYLNEERFARQFAGGHFRLKQWGRVKVAYALRQKGVSEYCLKKGLQEIEDSAYRLVLEKLAKQKWAQLKGEPPQVKHGKTRNFLLQRGFEPALIAEVLREI